MVSIVPQTATMVSVADVSVKLYSRLNIRCGIIDRIQNKLLCYFGHLTRMQDGRYPKIACKDYVHGVRNRGRPKKRWVDMIREDCKELNMTLQEAAHMTRDRKVWRATIDERLTRATESPGAPGHLAVVTRPYT